MVRWHTTTTTTTSNNIRHKTSQHHIVVDICVYVYIYVMCDAFAEWKEQNMTKKNARVKSNFETFQAYNTKYLWRNFENESPHQLSYQICNIQFNLTNFVSRNESDCERERDRNGSVFSFIFRVKSWQSNDNQHSWVNVVPLKYLWMVKLIFHSIWTEMSRQWRELQSTTIFHCLSLELLLTHSLTQMHGYNLYTLHVMRSSGGGGGSGAQQMSLICVR